MNQEKKSCSNHKENQAIAFCNKCNSSLCGKCIIVIDNNKICKICYDRIIIKKVLTDSRKDEIICKNCTNPNPLKSKFCNSCGKSLIPEQKVSVVINAPSIPIIIPPYSPPIKQNEMAYKKKYEKPPVQTNGRIENKNSIKFSNFLIKNQISLFITGSIILSLIIYSKIVSLTFSYSIPFIVVKITRLVIIFHFLVMLVFYIKKLKKVETAKTKFRISVIASIFITIFYSFLLSIASNNFTSVISNYEKGIAEYRSKNFEKAFRLFKSISTESPNFRNVEALLDSSKVQYYNTKYSKGLKELTENNYKEAHSIFSSLTRDFENNENVKKFLDSTIQLKKLVDAESLLISNDFLNAKNKVLSFLETQPRSSKRYEATQLLSRIERAENYYLREASIRIETEQKPATQEKTIPLEINTHYETFMGFKYWWAPAPDVSDKRIYVNFSPRFLPRDDMYVLPAMIDIINKVYGQHKLVSLDYEIDNRGSVNVIKYKGVDCYYVLLPIKQDTGEVHSFVIWTE